MWTKLRNVVRGVAQFKHAIHTSSEKGATLSPAGEKKIFSVTEVNSPSSPFLTFLSVLRFQLH